MTPARPVDLLATGAHLPGPPIDNEDLAKLSGPLPPDVLAGLQVKRRHWLADPATGEHTTSTSAMAAAAAGEALHRAGVEPSQVDLIVVSTASPEYHLPTCASSVGERLGLTHCATIELRAGCIGAVQALDLARRYLADGGHDTALVIGAEAISPLLVPMYLGLDPNAVRAYISACLGLGRKPGMQVIGGGTDIPLTAQAARRRLIDIRLDAAGVATFGPHVFATALQTLLHRADLRLADVDACVLPEGNAEYFSSELEAAAMSPSDHDLVQSRIVENLADVGATGSPAVLLALHAAVTAGRIEPGHTVLLVAIEASRYLYAGALRWGTALVA